MEGKTAVSYPSFTEQIRARAAEDARHVSLGPPPELDGVAFDPWDGLLGNVNGDPRLASEDSSGRSSESGDAESDEECTKEVDAAAGQADHAIPPLRAGSFFSSDSIEADLALGGETSIPPAPKPKKVPPADAAPNAAKGSDGKSRPASPDKGAKSVSEAAKEYWTSQLDDSARAAFERKAAVAQRRHEKFQQLKALSEKVKSGDQAAVGEIHRILEADPDFWNAYGDVGTFTESFLIDSMSGGLLAVEESVRRKVAAMKESLLGENATPLEEMGVQRVICCWLFTHFLDRRCTAAVREGSRASDLGRLQESAEKRYQSALKSLKLIQGIKSPAERRSKETVSTPTEGMAVA